MLITTDGASIKAYPLVLQKSTCANAILRTEIQEAIEIRCNMVAL
jgi:hypothetical protein